MTAAPVNVPELLEHVRSVRLSARAAAAWRETARRAVTTQVERNHASARYARELDELLAAALALEDSRFLLNLENVLAETAQDAAGGSFLAVGASR
jgi:hypothetical protein